MSLSNTASEILSIRKMLADAGGMRAITKIDELNTSESVNRVFPKYTQIFSVSSVWLATDPDHLSTNYYTGANAAFNAYTGAVTLDPELPSANVQVIVSYTYFKGLSDEVIDDQVTSAKLFVEHRTDTEFDWTLTTTRDIKTAWTAVQYRAAQACLMYQYAPDILQMGFNFSIEEFRVESKTWAGSMGIRDLLELWNKHVNEQLAILGEYWYHRADSTAGSTKGRRYHGYEMDTKGDVT